ncbi:hypothetical protein [Phreatobacter sp. AB_2022a]|uniref:hypothetical protein n=1 Tax=Phreatobacter sp. AB_2022a TaxID=3003134 RepID=UPI002286EA6A|nr:hypothetical protein [Phreatobacter sp. AB_2022a]MCZ0733146.1 hypothetical protein [Phreatobacter sp. AB_2022a]
MTFDAVPLVARPVLLPRRPPDVIAGRYGQPRQNVAARQCARSQDRARMKTAVVPADVLAYR